jgi:hypothetical protein
MVDDLSIKMYVWDTIRPQTLSLILLFLFFKNNSSNTTWVHKSKSKILFSNTACLTYLN